MYRHAFAKFQKVTGAVLTLKTMILQLDLDVCTAISTLLGNFAVLLGKHPGSTESIEKV